MRVILNGDTPKERARQLRLIERSIAAHPDREIGVRHAILWAEDNGPVVGYTYRTKTAWVASAVDQ